MAEGEAGSRLLPGREEGVQLEPGTQLMRAKLLQRPLLLGCQEATGTTGAHPRVSAIWDPEAEGALRSLQVVEPQDASAHRDISDRPGSVSTAPTQEGVLRALPGWGFRLRAEGNTLHVGINPTSQRRHQRESRTPQGTGQLQTGAPASAPALMR